MNSKLADKIQEHPLGSGIFWTILVVILVYGAINEMFVRPRSEQIVRLQQEVDSISNSLLMCKVEGARPQKNATKKEIQEIMAFKETVRHLIAERETSNIKAASLVISSVPGTTVEIAYNEVRQADVDKIDKLLKSSGAVTKKILFQTNVIKDGKSELLYFRDEDEEIAKQIKMLLSDIEPMEVERNYSQFKIKTANPERVVMWIRSKTDSGKKSSALKWFNLIP